MTSRNILIDYYRNCIDQGKYSAPRFSHANKVSIAELSEGYFNHRTLGEAFKSSKQDRKIADDKKDIIISPVVYKKDGQSYYPSFIHAQIDSTGKLYPTQTLPWFDRDHLAPSEGVKPKFGDFDRFQKFWDSNKFEAESWNELIEIWRKMFAFVAGKSHKAENISGYIQTGDASFIESSKFFPAFHIGGLLNWSLSNELQNLPLTSQSKTEIHFKSKMPHQIQSRTQI